MYMYMYTYTYIHTSSWVWDGVPHFSFDCSVYSFAFIGIQHRVTIDCNFYVVCIWKREVVAVYRIGLHCKSAFEKKRSACGGGILRLFSHLAPELNAPSLLNTFVCSQSCPAVPILYIEESVKRYYDFKKRLRVRTGGTRMRISKKK